MMRKFHEAKENGNTQLLFGVAGTPERISVCRRYGTSVVFALEIPDYLYNVGTGEDLTIKQFQKPSRK
jgi:GDP-L-fucose synthase